MKIEMVDLESQYLRLKEEIDQAIRESIASFQFINGHAVLQFERELADYLNVDHVVSCANGTDALQIALMACDFNEGDEIIIPAFTYASIAEACILLKLVPVMIDVDIESYNIDPEQVKKAITSRTRAIVPVHLFGQFCNLNEIKKIATNRDIMIIEDNAQSVGGFTDIDDNIVLNGDIGCTSFFPSKNLGCFGDGGAMYTNNAKLAQKMRLISRHGQKSRFDHEVLGVNSRLDTIQANILRVKLKELDNFIEKRRAVGSYYSKRLQGLGEVIVPQVKNRYFHVYNQYTLRVLNGKRNGLKRFLSDAGIPSKIYYPKPLYAQNAFKSYYKGENLPATERLCAEVLSIPIHTEMNTATQNYICDHIIKYFK